MCSEQENNINNNYGAVIAHVDKVNLFTSSHSVSRESQLRKILNSLLEAPINEEAELDKSAYSIDGKLDFNNIEGDWYEIITEEFFLFESTISGFFKNSIDGVSPKGKFLLQMKRYYREAKNELNLTSISMIKENSSKILDKVFNYIYYFLETKNEIYEHFDKDNIKVLVAFGFVECKILEKPKD